MIIAIGSTRGPKVEAVRRVISVLRERFPTSIGEDVRIVARAVPSGTASTPQSTQELMEGARNRALRVLETLSAQAETPTLAVGLEGGLRRETLPHRAGHVFLLEPWAFATNGDRGFFGTGGSLPLPDKLVEAVVEGGEDLGPAADRYYGERDVAGRQGTFGVLTAEIVTREEAFVRALLHAMAPFYNPTAYGEVATESGLSNAG